MPHSALLITAGSVSVTPGSPMPLTFAEGTFTASEGDLQANAVVLRQNNKLLVLCTLDFFSVSLPLREAVLAELNVPEPLTPANFLFFSSHTHFAPNIDETKPRIGPVDADYTAFVASRTAALLQRLLTQRPVLGHLEYGEGSLNHSINRRRRVLTFSKKQGFHYKVRFLPNPQGVKDETLRLFKAYDEAGNMLAVFWNYASHPVCFPLKHTLSPDYPGEIRAVLQKKLPGTPVLYLPGFAGNLRPDISDIKLSATGHLKQLFYGRVFGKATEKGYRKWIAEMITDFLPAFYKPMKRLNIHLAGVHGSLPLSGLLTEPNSDKALQIQVIRIAERTVVVALSAEVVVEYYFELRNRYPHLTIIPLGYTDFLFGYLPTEAMLPEGGYETDEWQKFFSIDGAFKSGTEEKVLTEICRLIDECWAKPIGT